MQGCNETGSGCHIIEGTKRGSLYLGRRVCPDRQIDVFEAGLVYLYTMAPYLYVLRRRLSECDEKIAWCEKLRSST